MKIIEPKVELLSEIDISPESHIARCSRICYGHEDKEPNQEADEKMVDGLIKRQHLSMLRHASMYFYHLECTARHTQAHIANSPYWNYSMSLKYASTNLQEFMRSKEYREPATVINNSKFLDECSKHPELFELYRMTFCITTQISTSRELNRKSPNAIAERSTRYCSSKDGLLICRPWWWETVSESARDEYLRAFGDAEYHYKVLLEKGFKIEDARGVLPLDTATKVIYTYSIQEWQHILGLRYYGATGKPHPNAKLIAGKIRDEINNFAKEHNIDYQV